MSEQSNPAEFRAKSTALYQRIRVWLIRMMVVAGVIGLLGGAVIGLGLRSHFAEVPGGPGWFLGGLIGLAAGAVCGAIVAVMIWIPVSLLYAMTQDGA